MSGTASANVFSGDPAKKFDVVFGIDMKQLLTELGVKPAEVQRILLTAERNASKVAAVPGGVPLSTPLPAANAQARPAALPGPPFATPTPMPPGPPTASSTAGSGQRGGARGGEITGTAAEFIKAAAAKSKFSDEDLAKAKLPPPPEETSQLDVLLRPGLLADVEIIVEKIPNALHVPVQAVFEKEGKPIVYVQTGKNFEARVVGIARRSESTMVLAGGVKPDEVVALADPFARKSRKEEPKKGGSGNPMGGVPAGGGGGK
jgi:multidrug efflux pump subunit AcrA (membrane-fusion protein)